MLSHCSFLYIALVFVLLSFSSGNAVGLKVALYPYVPRIGQFEKVITEYWKQLDPETSITWINDVNQWDGGYSIEMLAVILSVDAPARKNNRIVHNDILTNNIKIIHINKQDWRTYEH